MTGALRCFVAIELPDAVRSALGAAQERLRASAPRADVRWVDPAGMHLTLKFLGKVPAERVGAVRAAVGEVAALHPPMALVCAGLGVFPGPGRPRVFWAGLTGPLAELGRLAREIELAVEPLGFPREARPFTGHVTLGRARSTRGVAHVVEALVEIGSLEFGGWTAGEVVLFQSHLHPTGARYEAVARLDLGGRLMPGNA
jgi:2'-5' RNA ligase